MINIKKNEFIGYSKIKYDNKYEIIPLKYIL